MQHRVILLVEDNPSDVDLTRRALQQARITNELIVAPDGQEALDLLFGTGTHAGPQGPLQPAVILLDLKLPRVDGI